MSTTNPQVDVFLNESVRWRVELTKLRSILLECGLTEEYKWRAPCYTVHGKNVVILADLKDCCTLSFFKGGLLKDPQGLLKKPGENTRAARLIRFTNASEIDKREATLKSFVEEAIAIERAGKKFDFDEARQVDVPQEFQDILKESPDLNSAFQALTPGRQRAYLIYFSGAKQSQTRISRINKYRQQILDGKGINDCTCGLSKRLPQCDGSHKALR